MLALGPRCHCHQSVPWLRLTLPLIQSIECILACLSRIGSDLGVYIAPVLVVGTREEEGTLLQRSPCFGHLTVLSLQLIETNLIFFRLSSPSVKQSCLHWCFDFVQRHHPEKNGASAEGCKEAATSVPSLPPVAEAIDQGCTWKEPSLSPGPQAEAMAVPRQGATLLVAFLSPITSQPPFNSAL